MKRLLIACSLLLPSALFAAEVEGEAFTGGDAEAGSAKAAVCAACHGQGGNSANPEWPSLAGQNARYLYDQLKAFKSGARNNPIMMGQAAGLSDTDMRDLAAYYAAQEGKPLAASEEAVETAQPLWRAGNAEKGVPACAACHGPAGGGNAGAAYPRLAGQHPKYLATQLRAFRAGERGEGVSGQMMRAVTAPLSDAEIEALAAYASGLSVR